MNYVQKQNKNGYTCNECVPRQNYERKYTIVLKSPGTSIKLSRIESYIHQVLTVWLVATHLTSLSLGFLICKMGITLVPMSR